MAPLSEWSPEERNQLHTLQDELQALKSAFGRSLRLSRATPAEAPATAPFPITLTFSIDPPAAAAHYDVSTVALKLNLSREALSLREWAATAAAAAAAASGTGATHGSLKTAPPGTSLEVLPGELPRALRGCIEQELCRAWCQALVRAHDRGAPTPSRGVAGAAQGPGPYGLSAAASHLQAHFVHLISLVPELLEPYQAEDEHGATVRRYAIVNTGDDDNNSSGNEAMAASAACGGGPAASGVGTDAAVAGTNVAASTAAAGSASAAERAGLPAAGADQARSAPAGTAFVEPEAAPSAVRPVARKALAAAAAGDGSDGPGSSSQRLPHGHPAGAPAGATAGPLPPVPPAAASCGRTGLDVSASLQAVQHASAAGLASAEPPAASGGDPGSRPVAGPVQAAAPSSGPTQVPGHSPGPGLARVHQEEAPKHRPEPQSPPEPAAPPPPPGLLSFDIAQKELHYIQKRYSQVFSARVHREEPAGAARTSGAGAGGGPMVQPGCLTTFELELLPTDPDWDMPAVRLVGQLLPVTSATYLPSLGVHMASRLPPWLRAALEAHLAQQLAAEARAAQAALEAAAAVRAAAAVAETEAARATEAQQAGTASLSTSTAAATVPAQAPAAAAEAAGQETAKVAAAEVSAPGRGARQHSRGCGRGPGGGGAQRGRGGGVRPDAGAAAGPGHGVAEAPAAPEGTVLLPLGVLRNLFRNLENYAGSIARAEEEERKRREAAATGAGGIGDSSEGYGGSSGDDDDDGGGGGGLEYDDDGYGDGSRRRRGGGSAAPAGNRGSDQAGDDSEGDDSNGEDDDDDEDEEEGAAQDEVRFSGAAAAGGDDLPAAYAVVLEGLQLDNLAVVEVLRANFEVSCARCGARASLTVASSTVAGGSGGVRQQHSAEAVCARCTSRYGMVVRPHYVHATSNSLCVVKPQGCRPLDLLPSLMAGQCGECNAVMSLREVQVGLPFTRTCSSCHKELLISVAAVSFIPRGPPAGRGGTGGPRTAPRRAQRDANVGGGGGGGAVLRPGEPLPALGTCKHYRHSYRWLRFPCCGMRFPCDLCHEEAVPDGHPVRWAQRMVCGFCSTEQPVALGCRACGRQLAGSGANPSGRRTRFWEGGTGCRDPRRLNKNDPHKWRGRNKTQSAKASRVGPKAWSGKGAGAAGGSGASGGAG